MNIKNVIDSSFAFQNDFPNSSDAELKRYVCEKLLEELKTTTAEELLPHLRSVDLVKKERQVVVTLTFPWEVTVSNFL